MRSRKTGIIANVGSMFGWQGFAGNGLYCSTKFALVGITEALRLEVAHLGIEVTVIEPGTFRTKLVANIQSAAKSIEDFQPVMDPVRKFIAAIDGNQLSDAAKGAQVLVEVLTKSGRCEGRMLPLRLPLGIDSVTLIEGVMERETKSLREWADIISATDYVDKSGKISIAHAAFSLNMS